MFCRKNGFSLQPRSRASKCEKMLCASLCALLLGCTPRGPEVVIHGARGNEIHVPVEVARTEAERRHGLMYRKNLAADAGMLFVFPRSAHQRFWMKNTPTALDMVFIGEDRRIVGIVEDARPFSTEPRGVARMSRFVLEVHAGFARRHAIRVGNRVDLPLAPSPASRLKSSAPHTRSSGASAN